MADLLIFLEEWEWARQGMIEELSRALGVVPTYVVETRSIGALPPNAVWGLRRL